LTESRKKEIKEMRALQYVPFSALSLVSGQSPVAKQNRANNGPLSNYRPLMQDFEVVSLPSASVLAIQRQGLANRKPAPDGIAVIADRFFLPITNGL
jgi:hypothetical protein